MAAEPDGLHDTPHPWSMSGAELMDRLMALAANHRVLVPGATCWRLEQADDVRFLMDAAEYYDALLEVLPKARRSIFWIGWDVDPLVPLHPGRKPRRDEERLGRLFQRLAREHPQLVVRVLKWEMALAVAVQYPSIPMGWVDLTTHPRVRWVADDEHPPGACHHQKIVVIDDRIAFCGGIDIARDRFDTSAHRDVEPRRHTPAGKKVEPHHDVAIRVSGDAARALGDLARDRWRRATGETLSPVAHAKEPVPDDLRSDVRRCHVGISRTDPAWRGRRSVSEIDDLYLKVIRSARSSLYIENQYLTAGEVIDALEERLREKNGPDVILVLPTYGANYFDRELMDPARDQAVRALRAADRHGHLGVYAPFTRGGKSIVVHSKVMVCDDVFATVGSANLSNRSLMLDTECNVSIEANGEGQEVAAEAVRKFRTALLADHLGLPFDEVGDAARAQRLLPVVESLRHRTGRLRPLDSPEPEGTGAWIAERRLFDPRRPEPLIDAWLNVRRLKQSPILRVAAGTVALGIAAVVVLGWLHKRHRQHGGHPPQGAHT